MKSMLKSFYLSSQKIIIIIIIIMLDSCNDCNWYRKQTKLPFWTDLRKSEQIDFRISLSNLLLAFWYAKQFSQAKV